MSTLDPEEPVSPEARPTQTAPLQGSPVGNDSRVGTELAGRFQLTHKLGEGGMGVVYAATDKRQPGVRLALKVLNRMSPAAIYRLKNEFRGLANVSHPNLVSLGELVSSDGLWFFTMELLASRNFNSFVCNPEAEPGELACDLPRLTSALRQLTLGVMAIHGAGLLHRDLKPSNVMVEDDGRLVVVDFGLIRDQSQRIADRSEAGFVGTPAYGSPEQVDPNNVSEASDWYAVGCMLYEALTGRLPFDGPPHKVLHDKQLRDPQPPGELVRGVPPALNELCVLLLTRDPSKRAQGQSIVDALPKDEGETASSSASNSQSGVADLVGRDGELQQLSQAFDRTCSGEPACIFVGASSGTGKTALVEYFLEGLRTNGDAEVFAGRCYAQEEVPYKAFDSLIDAITRYLNRLPAVQSAALLPRDTQALAQLFPVLNRVEAVTHVPVRLGKVPDGNQVRERAFAALKQLLGGLTDLTPVVLFIDDLQWGDEDSVKLLEELLSPPDAPPLLLVATYRIEERHVSPVLTALLDGPAADHIADMSLPPLSDDAVRSLATKLISASSDSTEALVTRVVGQCEGHPLFVTELARYLASSGRRNEETPVSLEQALESRIAGVSEESRDLLELIALAGKPVSRALLSGCLPGLGANTWSELRTSRLVRVRSADEDLLLESYHDRAREVAVGRLSDARREQLHRTLAAAYTDAQPLDAQAVVEHHVAAGEPELAAPFAAQAAEQMVAALALNRAARLVQLVLEHTRDAHEAQRLRLRVVDLLIADGEYRSAAEACLTAAEYAEPEDALTLRRRAMELFLTCSHEQEGYALLADFSESVDIAMPRSHLAAMLRAAPRLLLTFLQRGPSYSTYLRHKGRHVSAALRHRSDVVWSAFMGVLSSDYTLSWYYASHMVRLLPRVGEPGPYAVAYAFWHMVEYTFWGADSSRRAMLKARSIAKGSGGYYTGWVDAQIGTVDMLMGRWQYAYDRMEKVEQESSVVLHGATSPLHPCQHGRIACLYWLGRLDEFRRLLSTSRRGAVAAANRNSMARLEMLSILDELIEDRPDAALRTLEALGEQAEEFAFHGAQDPWWHAIVHLYRDEPQRALEASKQMTRRYRWNIESRFLVNRTQRLFYEGLCHAAAFIKHGQSRDRRGLASTVRSLSRVKHALAHPFLSQLRATQAALGGERERALDLLQLAADAYSEMGMEHFSDHMLYRHGRWLGGYEGERGSAAALASLERRGVADVERWTCTFAPFPTPER